MNMRTTFLFVGLLFCTAELAQARLFRITNKSGSTIYVGTQGNANKTAPENGGFALDSQQERDVNVEDDWQGRFWARTGCTFNGDSGTCETGDCGGKLECKGAGGATPATLVEITLNGDNGQDTYDVSLVDGFNFPASIAPAGQQGQDRQCTTADCPKDLNPDCPEDLKVKFGDNTVACKSSCVVTGSDQDCCKGQFNDPKICQSSTSAAYFKPNCPNAYSYAYNDGTSTFRCESKDYPYDITFG